MKLDAGIYEFMKAFRDDRLAKMDSGEIPVSLADGPATVIHLLPSSAFEPGAAVDLSAVAREHSLSGLAGEQWGLSYDFEGVLVWESSDAEETRSYVQVFRNGVVEIADTGLIAGGPEGGKTDIRTFERRVSETLRVWIGVLAKAGARGPLALVLTLLHVRDWSLDAGDTGDSRLVPRSINRDDLLAPETFLEDLASDPTPAFKALFDPIWNAAGYSGSKGFPR
jgi:hypothetical protein